MSKYYCKSCGQPTECLGAVPKFCSSCGKSFSTMASVIPKVSARKVEPVQQDLDDLDNTDADGEDSDISGDATSVPDISQEQFNAGIEIDIAPTRNKTTIGSIVKNMPETPPDDLPKHKKRTGRPPKRPKKEDVWKQFAAEAGPLRKA